MSDKTLHVELVAADRLVWSGEATSISARTAAGDIGILPDHAPVLSVLHGGVVEIHAVGGDTVRAAVSDGFLSVAHNRISILSDRADLATHIDRAEAQSRLDELQAATDADPAELRLATGRVEVAAKGS
ncbi:MAG: F0F1 ATP synthase subunit epsilon [Nocardioides sp.]